MTFQTFTAMNIKIWCFWVVKRRLVKIHRRLGSRVDPISCVSEEWLVPTNLPTYLPTNQPTYQPSQRAN
jgi:hypothetical protein